MSGNCRLRSFHTMLDRFAATRSSRRPPAAWTHIATAAGVSVLAVTVAACGGSVSTNSKPSQAATTATQTQPNTTTTTPKPPPRKNSTNKTTARSHATAAKTTTTTAPTTATSSEPRTTTTHTTTTSTTPTSTAPTYTPPVHVTLVGPDHDPIVNQKWTYTVTITDAKGLKLSGTETTQYLFNGEVVGTEKPENVKFENGVYRDTIEFPATAVGYPLAVQATVKTSIGTGKADWTIKVKK